MGRRGKGQHMSINFNNEGYFDETAYKALLNVQKGNIMNNYIKTGEVWEIESTNGNMYIAVIIADDGNVVNFIRLIDSDTSNSDFEVNCRGIMYGSSRMVQYCFCQKVKTYIRTLSGEEYEEIMQKVADSLGIEGTERVIEKVIEKEAEPVELEVIAFDAELEKTKAQLEVYKDLYEKLLQKMVG